MTRDQRTIRVVRALKARKRRKIPNAVSAAPAGRKEIYIRFVTHERDDQSGSSRGVFHAAYELQKSTQLESHEYDWLGETIIWYQDNLPVPSYFKRRKADDSAICWFRVSAQGKIGRLWEMVHLLKEYGVYVRTIRTRNPGEIVFQDEYQIVAVPSYRTPR